MGPHSSSTIFSDPFARLDLRPLEMGLALTLKSHEKNQKEIFCPGGDE